LEKTRRFKVVDGKNAKKTILSQKAQYALVRLSRLIGLLHRKYILLFYCSKKPILEKKQKVWKTTENPADGDFQVRYCPKKKNATKPTKNTDQTGVKPPSLV